MTNDEIRTQVLDVLAAVVPELEPAELDAAHSLRDQLDIDSMDLLSFMVGLHRTFGIDIPEADYRKLATLDDCVAYVAQKTAGPS